VDVRASSPTRMSLLVSPTRMYPLKKKMIRWARTQVMQARAMPIPMASLNIRRMSSLLSLPIFYC